MDTAFACCLVLNAKAAGGQRAAADGAYPRFRCSQGQDDEVGGLGQWPLVSWFPRTAVVKSQLPRHLPNIVSFLMGRASSPEAHYSCGSQFDRHGQCGDSSQPGASYWLVGVEPCMTLVVLFPGEVIGNGNPYAQAVRVNRVASLRDPRCLTTTNLHNNSGIPSVCQTSCPFSGNFIVRVK